MAIASLKIHPAIGIARLGNSPDEFVIGPERLWDPPDPPGGFWRRRQEARPTRASPYRLESDVTRAPRAALDAL
jgi:hypothetical protein